MRTCEAPVSDETLVRYWTRDLAADETDSIEMHLFECSDCVARLASLATIEKGLLELVRRGRVSGIISRALLNRMQREGVYLRLYSLAPGEVVPCTVFPGDDLVVASLRADFSGVPAVRLSVTWPGDAPMREFDDVPVSRSEGEVLWALPGAVVRQLPSTRLRLTLTSTGAEGEVVGEYVLEHSRPDAGSS